MTDLKAVYPFGQQLCAEVTPDNKRMFTADGAGIAILNVTSLGPPSTPPIIDRVKTPDCSSDALLYYQHPESGDRSLFIAGGTLGLWRMELCWQLFSTSPSPCASYPLDRIDIVEDGFVRKRCVDLAIVEGNAAAGNPILFAIYAARAGTGLPMRASELHAFKLMQDGSVPAYGNTVYFDSTTIPGLDSEAKALAIASDPGDPNSVYVALGTGGLCKVNISSATFSASAVTSAQCPLTGDEQMRDLAVVRTATQGLFIYAAMDYGRILEYHPAVTGWDCNVTLVDPYLAQIAAATDGVDRVLVAVGSQNKPGITSDSLAPWQKDGIWTDSCIQPGLNDPNPNAPPTNLAQNSLRFFTRNLAGTAGPLTELVTPRSFQVYWQSLALRRVSGETFRAYACSTYQDTEVWKIEHTFTSGRASTMPGIPRPPSPYLPVVQKIARYIPEGVTPNDGMFSEENPGLFFLGGDAIATNAPGDMLLRLRAPTEPGGLDFELVDETDTPCAPDPTPPLAACGGGPPSAIVQTGSIMGMTSWLDPADPGWEWVMAATPMYQPRAGDPCIEIACPGDTCVPTNTVRWVERLFDDPNYYPAGWKITKLRPGFVGGLPPTGSSMEAQWWQLPSFTVQPVDINKTRQTPYLHSRADPRVDADGVPVLIHLVRGYTNGGLKFVRPRDIMTEAFARCPGTSGFGETLTVPFQEGITHVEAEDPGSLPGEDPCRMSVRGLCGEFDVLNPGRALHNARSETFSVLRSLDVDPELDERWVTVVAAGFVGASPDSFPPQPPSCLWDDTLPDGTPKYFGRPNLVVLDVTDTAGPSFPPPTLLRVALGPRDAPGQEPAGGIAWAVKTKTYGTGLEARVYAFVADLRGRLLVFDVSADQIYPAATTPYLPGTPPLAEVFRFDFPADPYDGRRPNFVDIEIDGDHAYCAVGRAGIAIFDISDPLHPNLLELLDTPGMPTGMALRTDENGSRQLLVGDMHCGVRLYGRPNDPPTGP